MNRFWSKVDKTPGYGPEGDCWLWTAFVNKGGYGRFGVGRSHVPAHRFAYELTKGPLPAGMLACHRCDVRHCVNPAHIFPGTAKDNTTDAIAKGRFSKVIPMTRKPQCKRGHDLSVHAAPTTSTQRGRSCRLCKQITDRGRRARLAA